MSIQREDTELMKVQPDELARFIEERDWEPFAEYGDSARFYKNPAGHQLLVPLVAETEDYDVFVRDALRVVALSSGSSPDSLLQDIRHGDRDVFRFQATTGDAQGLIGLDDMPKLAIGSKAIIEDAVQASTIVDDEKKRYLSEAKFGLTESGSYVITMLSPPIPFELQHGLTSPGLEPPLHRKVTEEVKRSIRETRTALDDLRDGRDDAFDNAPERGIRLKMCEGLIQATDPFDAVTCRITECSLPLGQAPVPSVTRFVHSDVEFLMKAATHLKPDVPPTGPQEIRLEGFVKLFDRGQTQKYGKATLKTLMPDTDGEQTVYMTLDEDQYKIAQDSHSDRTQIKVQGTRERVGKNTWKLHNAVIDMSATRSTDQHSYALFGQGQLD